MRHTQWRRTPFPLGEQGVVVGRIGVSGFYSFRVNTFMGATMPPRCANSWRILAVGREKRNTGELADKLTISGELLQILKTDTTLF